MKLTDLIDELQGLEEDGLGDENVFVLAQGHPPFSLHHVEAEPHEDAGNAVTIWLRAEEM